MAQDAPAVLEIPLTQGKVAIIDAADYELVKPYKWWATKCGGGKAKNYYARAIVGGTKTTMHRFLLNLPSHLLGDHRNGNTLDNRRENIRPATRQQNGRNQPTRDGRRFKGAIKNRNRWSARITNGGRVIHLGMFGSAEDAARAYDAAAIEFFGEFARINFPASIT